VRACRRRRQACTRGRRRPPPAARTWRPTAPPPPPPPPTWEYTSSASSACPALMQTLSMAEYVWVLSGMPRARMSATSESARRSCEGPVHWAWGREAEAVDGAAGVKGCALRGRQRVRAARASKGACCAGGHRGRRRGAHHPVRADPSRAGSPAGGPGGAAIASIGPSQCVPQPRLMRARALPVGCGQAGPAPRPAPSQSSSCRCTRPAAGHTRARAATPAASQTARRRAAPGTPCEAP
jgi:hypothetical protein